MATKNKSKQTRVAEIRVLFPPEMKYLFDRIKQNADMNLRSHQAELLLFLEKNYK